MAGLRTHERLPPWSWPKWILLPVRRGRGRPLCAGRAHASFPDLLLPALILRLVFLEPGLPQGHVGERVLGLAGCANYDPSDPFQPLTGQALDMRVIVKQGLSKERDV